MALGNSFELSAALTQYIRNEAAGALKKPRKNLNQLTSNCT